MESNPAYQEVAALDPDDSEDPGEQKPGCQVSYCTKQENVERGNWFLNIMSIFALLGRTFSIRAFMMFPYLVFTYGKGFLACYLVILVLCGAPLMYMELSLGQFSSSGVLTCWPIAIFKGVGAAMVAYTVPLTLMSNLFMARNVYYLHELTQGGADTPAWASVEALEHRHPECTRFTVELYSWLDMYDGNCTTAPSGSYPDLGVCWSGSAGARDVVGLYDKEMALDFVRTTLTQEANASVPYNQSIRRLHLFQENHADAAFFQCKIEVSPEEPIRLNIAVASLVSWILIFAGTLAGAYSLGVVVMVTVPIVMILTLMLFVRAITLPGTTQNIFGGDFSYSSSTTLDVFLAATVEAVWTLSLGTGCIITIASYNRFHNSFVRDVWLTVIGGAVFHIIAAFTVVSFWEFIAHIRSEDVKQVASRGFWRMFVSMLHILAKLPNYTAWYWIWFLLVLFMLLNDMWVSTETVITAVLDQIGIRRVRKFRPLLVAGFCVLCFLVGLPLYSTHGRLWLIVTDYWSTQFFIMFIIICMIVCYIVYGAMTYFRHRHDVAAMVGYDVICIKSVVTWTISHCLLIFGMIIALFLFIHSTKWIHEDWNFNYVNMVTDRVLPKSALVALKALMNMYVYAVLLLTVLGLIIYYAASRNTSVRDLFRVSWRPALDRHARLVQRYVTQNPRWTQRYNPHPHPSGVSTQPLVTQPGSPVTIVTVVSDITSM